jgi:cytochrome P450
MRAADAAEKVSAEKPRLLGRHKAQLLGLLARAEQIELRWHLALMIPRLPVTAAERRRAREALERYLDDLIQDATVFVQDGQGNGKEEAPFLPSLQNLKRRTLPKDSGNNDI